MVNQESSLVSVFRTLRGLRMRLTLSYVLLFSLVLVSIGFIFREALKTILYQQSERVLDESWSGLRGYLRLEGGLLVWVYDPEDPDEAYTVERLRRVLMVADSQGRVLEISNVYSSLGEESKEQILKVLRTKSTATVFRQDALGSTFLVRMGVLRDQGREFFLAVGLPVGETLRVPDRFVRVYFLVMPVILLAIGVLGWFAAGRALMPLQGVAEATQVVSEGNLALRIPVRGNNDELDQLITTFNRMMEQLEQNFRQIRQFSIDASHELRTPITAVRGQLEVALLTAATKEQYREAIETSLQDVEKIGQIVKSLLLLAQAESGQLQLSKVKKNLAPAVEELVNQFRLAAEEKNVTLRATLPEVCMCEVDTLQFDRMVSNLLSNAVKYTPAGGDVKVSLSSDGETVQLRVSDNGPGIAPSHTPHIFDRFYRVREGERDPNRGVGLGLAFVSWAVKAHGGAIQVDSAPGRGTEFVVTLPAYTREGAGGARKSVTTGKINA